MSLAHTMELILTPDIEQAIIKQSNQRGITPQQLALEGLRQLFAPVVEDTQKRSATLVDFLNGFIGILHSNEFVARGVHMPENAGAQFGQLMTQKRHFGFAFIRYVYAMAKHDRGNKGKQSMRRIGVLASEIKRGLIAMTT